MFSTPSKKGEEGIIFTNVLLQAGIICPLIYLFVFSMQLFTFIIITVITGTINTMPQPLPPLLWQPLPPLLWQPLPLLLWQLYRHYYDNYYCHYYDNHYCYYYDNYTAITMTTITAITMTTITVINILL